MNLRTTILGLVTLLCASAALVLQVLSTNAMLAWGAWGLSAALGAGWVILNWDTVGTFLMRKSTRYGANLALVIFLILGILVFLNVLAKQHNVQKDVTRNQANTLSEQSRKVAAELNQEVKAWFFSGMNEKDKGEDVLKRYARVNKKFSYEFVDVDRKPTQAAAMGVRKKGTVVLTLEGTSKKMMVDQPTEEQLTNGLIKLLRSSEVAVYFTVGHDEHGTDTDADPLGFSLLKAELEKQGYTVKDLNLVSSGKVPADAALVVVGGPKKTFFPKELEILSAWISGGGHAALAVDLDVQEGGLSKGSRQLAALVEPYGVRVMGQMLVDPTSKVANVEPQVLLGFSGSKEHPITKDFAHNAAVANFLFPLTTYLMRIESPLVTITPLAITSAQAWAESDWSSLKSGRVTLDPGSDHQGKMDLAYAVEGHKPEGEAKTAARPVKFAVFADALFATNNLLDKVGNRDLMLNTIAWLADEDRFISIRAKEDPDQLRTFNNVVLNFVLLVTVFMIPVAMIALGTWVWWRRSKL